MDGKESHDSLPGGTGTKTPATATEPVENHLSSSARFSSITGSISTTLSSIQTTSTAPALGPLSGIYSIASSAGLTQSAALQMLENGRPLGDVGRGLGYGLPTWNMAPALYWSSPQLRFPIYPYALPWQTWQNINQHYMPRGGAYPYDARPSHSVFLPPSFTNHILPSPSVSPYGKHDDGGERGTGHSSGLGPSALWPDTTRAPAIPIMSPGLMSTTASHPPCLCRACVTCPPTPPFFPWPGYCSPSWEKASLGREAVGLLPPYPVTPSPILPTPPTTPSTARTTPPSSLISLPATEAPSPDEASRCVATPTTSTLSDGDISPAKSAVKVEGEISPSSPEELDITSSVDC